MTASSSPETIIEPMLFSAGIWWMVTPGGGLKPVRAGMAVRRHALHPVFHLGRVDAELMLQRAARPERRGLLIFRHADAAALEIRGRLDAGIAPHHDLGVKEFPRGEDRHADPAIVAAGDRHHQRGQRHLGDVEIAETQLPPEHFRRMQDGRDEVDPVGLDGAVEDRPGARIGGDGEAELKFHGGPLCLRRCGHCIGMS